MISKLQKTTPSAAARKVQTFGDETQESSLRGALSAERVSLVISSKSGVTTVRVPTHSSSVVLGRAAPAADVLVVDPSVSRAHARLHIGSTLAIEDLGSKNGTRVNGSKAHPGVRTPVAPGDMFALGGVTIVVHASDSFEAETPVTLKKSVGGGMGGEPIVINETMQGLYGFLERVAPTPLPVIILGETGTGKEVFAEQVHAQSDRRAQPFVQINCAALPEPLLEAELFGYERGAFTGAVQAKAGLFEAADTGTVFLDEIGEMPLGVQAKLLRVLETGQLMRLGAVRSKRVDFRLVAATNRDLKQRVAEGTFRADLYFRLNGMSFTLPALRDRREEIVPLAKRFAAQIAGKLNRQVPVLTAAAERALLEHDWPGNIRELRQTIERAVILTPLSEIDVEQLLIDGASLENTDERVSRVEVTPLSASQNSPVTFAASAHAAQSIPVAAGASSGPRLRDMVDAYEKQRIVQALEETQGNQSKAAILLGISRRGLIKKLDFYGLKRPRKDVHV